MTMNNLGWIFGAVCLLFTVVVILFQRKKTRKTMETLDNMLTAAMNGTFKESTFDESLLSALETRFAHYLSSSTLSAQNVFQERERIKALITDISHQTKTPISNIFLYTELLQEEKLSPECKEYTAILHTQTEKLRFLIDSLVKLSRLENGIIAIHPKYSPLATILAQIEQQFASKALNKGLTIIVNPTDTVAFFDSKWTTEAICNLVDNAIKYTVSGSVTISVISYEMFVRVDITDTGIGISEEEQANIFSRFYRSCTNAQQDGVGIGLYLAREIIRLQGGYIKVCSEVGKGSVFSVFLPI